MSEGTVMETMIAAGSVILVVGAVAMLIYRITMGERSARRLEKLKEELEKKK